MTSSCPTRPPSAWAACVNGGAHHFYGQVLGGGGSYANGLIWGLAACLVAMVLAALAYASKVQRRAIAAGAAVIAVILFPRLVDWAGTVLLLALAPVVLVAAALFVVSWWPGLLARVTRLYIYRPSPGRPSGYQPPVMLVAQKVTTAQPDYAVLDTRRASG